MEIEEKLCGKCGETKPLSEFYKNRTTKDGLQTRCKICCKAAANDWNQKNRERSRANATRWRKNNLDRVRETARKRRERMTPEERARKKEVQQQRYLKNRDEILAKARVRRQRWREEHPEEAAASLARFEEWKRQNPDKIKAATKKRHARWYRQNAERAKAMSRAWQRANPDRVAVITKRWRDANPERVRQKFKEWYYANRDKAAEMARRRRAREFGVEEHFTAVMAGFAFDFWDRRCAHCNSAEKLCIDHWLPLSKGYPLMMSNAVVLCVSCNSAKQDNMPEDIYPPEYVEWVEMRLDKQEDEWELAELYAPNFVA
jgi:hypothetical protein